MTLPDPHATDRDAPASTLRPPQALASESRHITEREHAGWCMTLFGYSCDCGAVPHPPMSIAECENAKANHDDGCAGEMDPWNDPDFRDADEMSGPLAMHDTGERGPDG